MIGVLGGMGPAATLDFMSKMIRLVPAERDQDHVPLLIVSDPRVPDRVGPILDGRGASPVAALLAGLRRLEAGGARAIAMPCHTAHAWAGELIAASGLPFLHIVEASLAEMRRRALPPGPVGLLATRATLKAGLYQDRLETGGWPPLELAPEPTGRLVLPAIALVKRGRADAAAPLLLEAVETLAGNGAQAVLLACTELPVALAAAADAPAVPAVDATEALARACITWWRENQGC
ncbi:MAG TPA: amino acid racemase [Geminicoccaceae bacterium]